MRTATVIGAVLAVGLLSAQEATAQQASAAYQPGLGEIMTLTQMRHSKLWFAGKARNWDLAAYELDELKEGFDDAVKLYPTHDNVPVGPMITSIMTNVVAALGKTIEAHDQKKFAAAFDGLTSACNSCHQAANKGFIMIMRPGTSPYTNQSFAPGRK
jgi:hypothetical protein